MSYAVGTDYWSGVDGGCQGKLSSTFGPDIARIPMPWAVTLRNLVVISHDPTRPSSKAITVMKNGSATSLGATLSAASDGPASDLTNSVSYAQFDDFSYRCVATLAAGFPGNTLGWSIDAESIGNIFGISSAIGNFNVGLGAIGGALGNGQWSAYDSGAGYSRSGSYSICATPGNVTTLVMKDVGPTAIPGGSSWIGFLIKNGVIQDGSGGTVDTRSTITAGNKTASSTFVLPLIKGDILEVAFYRTGTQAAFEANVGVGIGFIPTTAGMFMLTGGSNVNIADPTGYRWVEAEQGESNELLAMAPIGPSGLITRGIYVERGAPGAGNQLVHVVRHSGVDTAIAVTISDAETSAVIDGLYHPYADGATIDIRVTASGTTQVSNRMHWGLEVTLPGVVPPPAEGGVIGPHIWVIFPRTQPDEGSP